MAKFGAAPINDVSGGPPRVTYQAQIEGQPAGTTEERIDRRPSGKVERFVDPQGNVVNIQLSAAGDPNPVASTDKRRMELRREGFVEHAKCPLKHGIRHSMPTIEREFMPLDEDPGLKHLVKACDEDPKVMRAERRGRTKILYAEKACPHIEWLIADRREREKIENEKRFANRAQQEQREKEKRELEQLQLEEARERLKVAKGGKRGKAVEAE